MNTKQNPNRTQNRTKWFRVSLVFCFVSVLCLLPIAASAAGASFYLSPPSGTHAVGSTFSAIVKVDSGGETINAAEGTLIFNQAELQVQGLSKSGSIFSLWTIEPTFSNSEGNIIFGGGTPNNFTGTSGAIITISFKAKASASAQVSFSSGSALAADGKGTNILASMNGGTYTLKPKVTIPPADEAPAEEVAPEAEYIPPAAPAPAPTEVPAAPVIRSSTHPDPDKWYSNNKPEFSWQAPQDVVAVRLLIGKIAAAQPTVLYSPAISEKKIDELPDGIYYFHAQFKNAAGWGEISQRKVLIDTEPPMSFEIKVDNEGDLTNPSPSLIFHAEDTLSGIEYYEIKIDNQESASVSAAGKEPCKAPPQTPGEHTVNVTAFDEAGNFTSASAVFEILPIAQPEVSEIPKTVYRDEPLIIKGTALPEATVKVFLQKGEAEPFFEQQEVSQEGNLQFVLKDLEQGTYKVWAQAQDKRGALSEPTEKRSLEVIPPFVFVETALTYIILLVVVVVLIIGAVSIIVYLLCSIRLWRGKLKKETSDVSRALRKAYNILEELDKKSRLTKAERKVYEKLKHAFAELKDIKKCLQ